jgi:hypothetical protein
MANRKSRSWTVELNLEDDEFMAGESAYDWPNDWLQGLGCIGVPPEGNVANQQDTDWGPTDFAMSELGLRQSELKETKETLQRTYIPLHDNCVKHLTTFNNSAATVFFLIFNFIFNLYKYNQQILSTTNNYSLWMFTHV